MTMTCKINKLEKPGGQLIIFHVLFGRSAAFYGHFRADTVTSEWSTCISSSNKPSVQIYVNKIGKRVTFKIKSGYSLELLTSETTKLLGSTENKTTKDKNGENVLHLEITEVVLVHCDIVNNDYQQDSRVLYTFVPNKSLVVS